MGLAASQARLLFITARQNDVSARMQRISSANMVLARDEEDVMEKYNNMLNATKRVPVDSCAISYDALMGARAAAADKLAVVTDQNGHVVLEKSFADTLGIDARTVDPDIDQNGNKHPDYAKEVLAANGINSAQDLKTRMAEMVQADSGVDTSLTEAQAGAEAALQSLLADIGKFPVGVKKFISIQDLAKDMAANIGGFSYSQMSTSNVSGSNGLGGAYTILASLGDNINKNQDDCIKYLASDDSIGGCGNSGGCMGQAQTNIKALANEIIKMAERALGTEVGAISGYLSGWVDGLGTSLSFESENSHGSESDAVDGCRNDAKNKLVGNGTDDTATDWDFYMVNVPELARRVIAQVGELYSSNNAGGQTSSDVKAGKSQFNNVGTKFAIVANEKGYSKKAWEDAVQKSWNSLGGSDCGYSYEEYLKMAKSSATNSASNAQNTTGTYKNGYYEQLYNNLVKHGWTIHDNDTMGNINDLIQDGTYRVGSQRMDIKYTELYEEIPDEDMRAKAELFYKQEMQKIQRKEKQLDNELTKLQTEYTALTNDYNSVNGILNANIQRSFSYCQTG